jgi:diacylglycerol O-acyltransferase
VQNGFGRNGDVRHGSGDFVARACFALTPGYLSAASPPFSIVISNMSAGRFEPLYWRGARLDGNYPLSITLDGEAVNITVNNNADNLDFGLVGCRRSVPHLQRLLLPIRS